MNNTRHTDFTIFAHVYYPETWEEMANDLDAGIQQPFNLVITRPIGSRPVARPQSSYLCATTELEVENKGRDILPFLTALRNETMTPFDIGLKIHTKRSPHRQDGDGWRRYLVGSLLQPEIEGRLLGHKLLQCEPSIGLVAPRAHLLPLGGRTSMNEKFMLKTLCRIEQSEDESSTALQIGNDQPRKTPIIYLAEQPVPGGSDVLVPSHRLAKVNQH
ncbi:hypothetical protein PDO_4407 [Rhizobium sp. PDO1-076]|uniref:rhamnan synthesis F family protein n=1 Tax=Rhizobium sp. PDO1-076 TaxID=1125979 RepID=UPI00024E2562|nr:rhamnan synthesis F family protein [Rhizobium sp. PDO1-076]EHS53127.1 hypothetical protein PDO_4407 [Rhizobium sp. PDO1-076]